jgi:ribonuclease HI
MKYISIYTDGACKGNPGPAGFGVVVVINDIPIIQYAKYIDKATNNIAELKAIKKAFEFCEDYKTIDCIITIYSDSMYSINMIKNNKYRPRKHVELIGQMRCMFKQLKNTTLEHVNGHSGDVFNELADKLANDAIKRAFSK